MRLVLKALFPLLGVIGLGAEISPGFWEPRMVAEAIVFIAGIIGLAYVMRSDVKWLKEFAEQQLLRNEAQLIRAGKIDEILAMLTEGKRNAERRLENLENQRIRLSNEDREDIMERFRFRDKDPR